MEHKEDSLTPVHLNRIVRLGPRAQAIRHLRSRPLAMTPRRRRTPKSTRWEGRLDNDKKKDIF